MSIDEPDGERDGEQDGEQGAVKAPATGTAARRAQLEARQARPARPTRPTSSRGPAAAEPPPDGKAPTREQLDPDRLAALEEERDFLLRSLDDLEREHDAGDVDDVDYDVLVDDYTARAAEVLRAIDERRAAFSRARAPKSRGRQLGIAAVVVACAIGLGVFVAQSSGHRGAGDTITGDIRQTTRDQLLQAQQLYAQGKFVDAIGVYDQVLSSQPANVEALTYKAWLLRLTSRQATETNDRDVLLAKALELLDQAVTADPTYGDARVFRAVLRRDLGQPVRALEDLDAVPAGAVPVLLQGMVDNLRAELEQAAGTTSGSTPASTPGTAP